MGAWPAGALLVVVVGFGRACGFEAALVHHAQADLAQIEEAHGGVVSECGEIGQVGVGRREQGEHLVDRTERPLEMADRQGEVAEIERLHGLEGLLLCPIERRDVGEGDRGRDVRGVGQHDFPWAREAHEEGLRRDKDGVFVQRVRLRAVVFVRFGQIGVLDRRGSVFDGAIPLALFPPHEFGDLVEALGAL